MDGLRNAREVAPGDDSVLMTVELRPQAFGATRSIADSGSTRAARLTPKPTAPGEL